MHQELKQLIEQADALLARFCEALDRAERIAQDAEQLTDPFAGHPELPLATEDEAETRLAPVIDQSPIGFPEGLLEKLTPLPEPPEGKRWSYEGQGDGSERENIYTFNSLKRWSESDEMEVLPGIHYAVAVPA